VVGHYPDREVFKWLGKDGEGYMYFRCPSCSAHLQVDPLELSEEGLLTGRKAYATGRHVPLINGLIGLGLTAPIITYSPSWLLLILSPLCAFLWWHAIVAFKVALFGSKKAIEELTTPRGKLSEETKKEVIGRKDK